MQDRVTAKRGTKKGRLTPLQRLLPSRQQPSHRTVVVRCLPIPLRHVDVSAKIQAALISPIVQPVQRVVDQLARRLRGQKRAGWRVKGKNAVGFSGYRPPAFMNQVMMEGAERDQVVQAGLSAVQPVLDVMPVKEGRVGAPGEGAAAVTPVSYTHLTLPTTPYV